jgi:23S rRNA pseudouridine1911/1915/1917 synthase
METVNDAVENKEPTVLYEDTDVLVINKPAGLIVHGDGRTAETTLSDWLLARDPAMAQIGEPWTSASGEVIPRPGIVHRLDRDTSGVMIIGKTQEAFEYLKQQFKDRLPQKKYDALVYGHPKEDEGVIDKPIGRSPQDFRRWSAQPGARGEMREAQTSWKVLMRGIDSISGERVSLISAEPKTGRTHQIRVHMKAIHHPVLCDSLYASGKPCILELNRVALHARSLTITLPSGKEEIFEAPQPSDLQQAIERLSQ